MANELVNNRNEILGIDKVSEETRRVRTNNVGNLDVVSESIETKLGEVQASPTANTLLARLKSLEDKIDAITAGTTPATTTLTGSSLDLRGLNANKPLATAVQIGATYWSIDTDPNADAIEVSDGTNWVVMA